MSSGRLGLCEVSCVVRAGQSQSMEVSPCLGERDGALDAFGALDDGALADLLLLQQLLIDGVQQRLLRNLRVRALQRLRAPQHSALSGTAAGGRRVVGGRDVRGVVRFTWEGKAKGSAARSNMLATDTWVAS